MDQNDELASLKESIRIFERLTAAARLAAVYSDKKKILRYIYKTLKFERKQFGRSCYPMTDGYSGTILLMFSEFAETLEKLLGAAARTILRGRLHISSSDPVYWRIVGTPFR